AERLPDQLSGGEQERVAIARAIVNRPPILLADEPTGSLDSETAEGVMALLRQLNKEGLTIIMVTHNPEACRHGNRTILVRDGLCLTQ
ncbi:MAG: ATP-binding cassette domain-containing protein, partial [Proteobacteria bacterium]|nr:ATP-binding cassette domain-containing protein [Pseudomonadota bacterium]